MNESGQGLWQEQSLRLRLNPKQMRLGRLLEMSVPEFEDEVQRSLEENPALCVVDEPADTAGDDFGETAEQLMRADYASEDDIPPYRLHDSQSYTADRYEAVAPEAAPTAAESLTRQLADYDLTPLQLDIARYIIGNLDSNGYLTRSTADIVYDIAMGAGIDVTAAQVDEMIALVRSLEPAGIGARDLRDCLLLQIDRATPTVESITARNIIAGHFDTFTHKHYDRLAAALGIDTAALKDAIAYIRTLNPKPASYLEAAGADDRPGYIVPDFDIDTDSSGRVRVTVNGNAPALAIEKTFALDSAAPAPTGRDRAEAHAFIKARNAEAVEFIELARRRNETLMAVMTAIVRLQPDFFSTYERARIRPMVLRDVQRLTGLDLSVISRATASKYVMTPHGMFPLKMFFNEGFNDGQGTSSHAVAEALKTIIAAEDPRHPLSDAELADRLVADGYDVARRTVAKYRERMGIPVARLRRHLQ